MAFASACVTFSQAWCQLGVATYTTRRHSAHRGPATLRSETQHRARPRQNRRHGETRSVQYSCHIHLWPRAGLDADAWVWRFGRSRGAYSINRSRVGQPVGPMGRSASTTHDDYNRLRSRSWHRRHFQSPGGRHDVYTRSHGHGDDYGSGDSPDHRMCDRRHDELWHDRFLT